MPEVSDAMARQFILQYPPHVRQGIDVDTATAETAFTLQFRGVRPLRIAPNTLRLIVIPQGYDDSTKPLFADAVSRERASGLPVTEYLEAACQPEVLRQLPPNALTRVGIEFFVQGREGGQSLIRYVLARIPEKGWFVTEVQQSATPESRVRLMQ